MSFVSLVESAGKALDLLGITVIILGSLAALARYVGRLMRGGDRREAYRLGRQGIGRAIILGLELLVASDIIRTVAISPNFTSVGVLGLIVLIRTFLSTALELEVEGRWPWQSPPSEGR